MQNIEEIFRAALANFRKEYKSERKFALAVEEDPVYMNQILSGKKNPSDERKRSMAAVLGFPGENYEDFLRIGRNILAGRDPDSGNPALPPDEVLAEQGFMKVDFSDHMKLAAGGGGRIPITEPAENSKVIVHRASLGKGTYRPKQLQAFRVGGDSMEPLIAGGGIVLADITDNNLTALKEGSIYVLCWDLYDGECAVKYLSWAQKDKFLSIESEDSRRYKPVIKGVDEVKLIGRVIWSWREH
jgi:hypothetical protein